MSDKPRRKLHCAIYTRKSSDEGLEQDFNSLDAQREACEAYIVSQKHEGWIALPDLYDDGGISGATMERPALQHLLADIKARKVDVVVVYKVDRLTRALADFAKIVEIFDAQNVSFVSVTQQFNTTSSMGRLTLNVLLSFAQFEREVTAERIRDKIAASKKKGMWMGGTVPLGYDAKDRTLVINEPEAETVRTLFRLYPEFGTVRALQAEANRRGLRSKSGRPFAYGHLYWFLQNPVYIGRIRHKTVTYPGLHPAIIDQATWDTVQARLEGGRINRRDGTNSKNPSPLAGRLFDDQGIPFTPTHAVKKGKRYRYYVEREAIRPSTGKSTDSHSRQRHRRIAAPEIEGVAASAIVNLLRTPSQLLEAIGTTSNTSAETTHLIKSASEFARNLATKSEMERGAIVRTVTHRVTLAEDHILLGLSVKGLQLALGLATESSNANNADIHELTISARIRYRGIELKLVITDPSYQREAKHDAVLIKALIKANTWLDRLLADDHISIKTIAKAEGVTDRYVRRIIELAFLAPDIKQMILDGRQPANMSTEWLVRGAELPLDWHEQRHVLGLLN